MRRLSKYWVKRPWLDSAGHPLPLSSIGEISKSWSRETWDAYLQTVEGTQSEYIPGREFESTVSPDRAPPSEGAVAEDSRLAIKVAVAALPPLQQAVIESLLLEHISERDAAALYGVTRWKVRTLKQQALATLQARIDTAVSHS